MFVAQATSHASDETADTLQPPSQPRRKAKKKKVKTASERPIPFVPTERATPLEPTPERRLVNVHDELSKIRAVMATIDQAMRSPLEGAEEHIAAVLFEHAIVPLRDAQLVLNSALDQLRAGEDFS